MASSSSTDRVLVGRVGKAHGLRGYVVVHSDSDNPSRFARGAALQADDGSRMEIESATRSEADLLLVRFVGCEDRAAAEKLRGLSLWIESGDRRKLDPGEFWPDELIGAEVRSTDGRALGTIIEVVEGAAQDRLVVSNELGRFEIPFVVDLVRSVDVNSREVVVEAIEGLIDVP